MIIIISEDDFMKNRKVFRKDDILIINGTKNKDIAAMAGQNAADYQKELTPKDAIFEESSLSSDQKKDGIKHFLKRGKIVEICAIASAASLQNNMNVYIVLKNKVARLLSKKLKKRFEKITETEPDSVFIDFSSFDEVETTNSDVEKELKKIDKKIDSLKEESENFWDFVTDKDKDRVEHKIKKLRKERKALAEQIEEGKTLDVTKAKFIQKMEMKKSAKRKLDEFIRNYYEHKRSKNEEYD